MQAEEDKNPLCRIRDIYRTINSFEEDIYKQYGVKLNEAMLLCSLFRFKQCSSGDIAEILGLTNSNSSKVIASVEKKGLIERIVGKLDKRQMIFQLTSSGKECITKIHSMDDHIIELIEKIRKI